MFTHKRFTGWTGELDPDLSPNRKTPKGKCRYRTTGAAIKGWNMHVYWPAGDTVEMGE